MKKITMLLLVFMILLSVPAFSATNDPIKVIVNDNVLVFDVNPTVIEGRTVLPVGTIFKALGLEVNWDSATKTVTGTNSQVVIKLQIDQVLATVNGKEVTLEVPATVINGRTMVPARFVAEATGAVVGWNATTKTISIDKPLETGNTSTYTPTENETNLAFETTSPVTIKADLLMIISVDLRKEEVVIKNISNSPVQLNGYRLVSVKGNQVYTFPEYLLETGETVTVFSAQGQGDLKWTGSNMWNNDGDPAEIYDTENNLLDRN